jgi:hypothetical protein
MALDAGFLWPSVFWGESILAPIASAYSFFPPPPSYSASFRVTIAPDLLLTAAIYTCLDSEIRDNVMEEETKDLLCLV